MMYFCSGPPMQFLSGVDMLAFVTDIAVAMLLIRSCREMRIGLPASLRSAKSPDFGNADR